MSKQSDMSGNEVTELLTKQQEDWVKSIPIWRKRGITPNDIRQSNSAALWLTTHAHVH